MEKKLKDSWPSNSGLLQTIHANQLVIIGMLRALTTQGNTMAIDLTALQAEVANNTTVEGKVAAALSQLVAIIQSMPVSTDPATQAAINAVVATLSSNDTAAAAAAAAAVAAVTPPTP